MSDPSVLQDRMENGQSAVGPTASGTAQIGTPDALAGRERKILSGKLGARVRRLEQQLVAYNVEARGIQRVEEHERHAVGWQNYLQVFLLWVSINLAANNVTLGMLGPAVFGLGFRDASLCAVFGSILGSLPVAWIATWGPISGNRTLVRNHKACLNIVAHALSFKDIRPLCYGMVAKQAHCSAQHHYPHWIRNDQLCYSRPDTVRGVS